MCTFRWSLFFQFRDLGLLRNAHATVESLCSSGSRMYQYFGQCVALRLKFKDPEAPIFPLPARLCGCLFPWTMMSRTCRPWRSNSCSPGSAFRVPSTCRDRGDVLGLIVDTLKTAWRFTKVVGSRWVRLGPASQAVVVPALCGLDDPVSFIRSKVGAFTFHLGGFARFLEEAGVHGTDRHCVQGDSVLQ